MKKISITVLFFDTELIQLKNGKVFSQEATFTPSNLHQICKLVQNMAMIMIDALNLTILNDQYLVKSQNISL